MLEEASDIFLTRERFLNARFDTRMSLFSNLFLHGKHPKITKVPRFREPTRKSASARSGLPERLLMHVVRRNDSLCKQVLSPFNLWLFQALARKHQTRSNLSGNVQPQRSVNWTCLFCVFCPSPDARDTSARNSSLDIHLAFEDRMLVIKCCILVEGLMTLIIA